MLRRIFLSAIILAGLLTGQATPHAMAAAQCDSAQFVSDLTVPDGATFAPGAAFTKTWRLMNNGTCAWTTSYNLVWVGGDGIGAPSSIKLPVNVPPGQMVDISVNLTAPAASGHYKGLWKISNASGLQFGIGDSASDAFWVDINVIDVSAVIYDFVANAPYAQWKSGIGFLPYPGTSGDSRGFSYQVNNPHLEDDSLDSSPGLLTVPQNKYNGYIQAAYPEIQIQQGDKLQTLVNCEFGAKSCYVTFRIDYLTPTGVQRTLWSWKESQDKRFYRASLDLSPLAGQKIRFVFMLLSTGLASGDRALWGSPRIVRTGSIQPPAPPATLTPLPALTPTATPFNQPPPTIAPSGCDKASFIADVTVPDGTLFSPGAAFTKTWRLKNAGSCSWTTAYKFLFYSGEQMGAPTSINVPWNVSPGQTVDLTVNLVAPSSPGKFRGHWILSNANGALFGIGANASMPIWVEINVAGDSPIGNGYDFVANVCSAEWKSGAGALPCSGTDGNLNGFVIRQDAPKLEDGSTGAAGLLTFPQNRFNGYIQGFYPTFTVQPGDRFQTFAGCEFGANCNVTYRLDYMSANGGIKTFWSWREKNEKQYYSANVDLGPLAGQSVRFILTMLATGFATGDRAIWSAPRIVRTGSAPPTVTPIPPANDWLTYTNSTYGFQFKYPPQSQLFNQVPESLLIGLPIVPGTNLVEKYLDLRVLQNVATCAHPLVGVSAGRQIVVINGITFFKDTGEEGAVGQIRKWTGYSTVRGAMCVTMLFVLHSGNPSNYDPPRPTYDEAAESAVFLQMISTFAWLSSVPTPTPTYTPTPIPGPGPIVPSPVIRGLSMIDSSNGWAIGDSYLLRTADGGLTWHNVTMSGVSTFSGAFFKDSNAAWVLTALSPHVGPGSLYRTTDGGLTWVHYDVPFNNGGIQFLDNTHGFVLSSLGVAMNKEAVAIYQTSDGGATWVLKFHNDPTIAGAGTSLPLGGHKNGMTFRDATTGWIGGETPAAEVYLYKTTNSGATWALQHVAFPTGYESPLAVSTTAPTFFGANDAVLPVWITIGSGRDLFIYTSHDGGTTWLPSSGFARNAHGPNFVSLRDAISWDWANVFHITNDSGNSWRAVTPNLNFSDEFGGVDFVSTTTGWVILSHADGSTSLYRTMDGGATWALLSGSAPTPTPPPTGTATVQSVEIQIVESQPLQANAIVRGQLPDNGCTTITSTSQARNGNTFQLTLTTTTNPLVECTITPTPFEQVMALDVNNLPTAKYTVNANGVEKTFELVTRDLVKFDQAVVDALNARNFDVAKVLMDESFGFAYWQSEGTSYTADVAIEGLRTGGLSATTQLTPNASKDLITLLDGLNPYSIMGLDPAKSQALFVSGWGVDGRDEAILYATLLPDGSPYWHSVLIAPGGFARFSPATPTAPASFQGPYAVTRVNPGDVLNIRSGPGSFPVVGSFQRDAINVMRTGPTATADGAEWVEVQNPNGGTGWVNSFYLTEYVTPAAFCADPRIPILIEQLKGSMNQSNGDMLSTIISPLHGVNIHLWKNAAPINFTQATARNVFTSADAYNWGGGPSGQPDIGTFAQIIQPRMLDTLNAPTMQTYCDNLTNVPTLSDPWPYHTVRFYNLRKPSTSPGLLDFRTWLIGIEYVNNQPYLYAMISIVWEP